MVHPAFCILKSTPEKLIGDRRIRSIKFCIFVVEATFVAGSETRRDDSVYVWLPSEHLREVSFLSFIQEDVDLYCR